MFPRIAHKAEPAEIENRALHSGIEAPWRFLAVAASLQPLTVLPNPPLYLLDP
jgi:hypothetical protein